jgi:hypothetical protein
MADTKQQTQRPVGTRRVVSANEGQHRRVVAFKATGGSAIGEIGELVGMSTGTESFRSWNCRTRNFESQHGSVIYVPVFRLVSWEFWQADTPAPEVAPVPLPPAPPPPPPDKPAAIAARTPGTNPRNNMDDEIPF